MHVIGPPEISYMRGPIIHGKLSYFRGVQLLAGKKNWGLIKGGLYPKGYCINNGIIIFAFIVLLEDFTMPI